VSRYKIAFVRKKRTQAAGALPGSQKRRKLQNEANKPPIINALPEKRSQIEAKLLALTKPAAKEPIRAPGGAYSCVAKGQIAKRSQKARLFT
jgi:hypothetical protein